MYYTASGIHVRAIKDKVKIQIKDLFQVAQNNTRLTRLLSNGMINEFTMVAKEIT